MTASNDQGSSNRQCDDPFVASNAMAQGYTIITPGQAPTFVQSQMQPMQPMQPMQLPPPPTWHRSGAWSNATATRQVLVEQAAIHARGRRSPVASH